jgi:hypothetical protein
LLHARRRGTDHSVHDASQDIDGDADNDMRVFDSILGGGGLFPVHGVDQPALVYIAEAELQGLGATLQGFADSRIGDAVDDSLPATAPGSSLKQNRHDLAPCDRQTHSA